MENHKDLLEMIANSLLIQNTEATGSENTGGDSNKTLATKHKSVKPEAHLSLANG